MFEILRELNLYKSYICTESDDLTFKQMLEISIHNTPVEWSSFEYIYFATFISELYDNQR